MRTMTAMGLVSMVVMSATAAYADGERADGAVYTLSNETAGNAVLVFARMEDGSLRAAGSVATGGTGSGAGLGSQGAITKSRDGRWIFAVNAGDHSVSALRVERGGGLALVDVADSGGDEPVSVTESGGLVYVLNAGTRQNISGLTFDGAHLTRLGGSTRALSSTDNVGGAEVAFSPEGDTLVVTEKGTNRIDGFTLRDDGTPSRAVVTASSGETPFGFAFGARGTLLVSDAYGGAVGAGAVSSYRLGDDASARLVTGPVADGRTAPCWVAVAEDGRLAFTANAHDGTLSSYRVARDGAITLIESLAASIGTTSAPTDLDVVGRDLYVHDAGTGAILVYAIERDGSLVSRGRVSGLPASANGLVAR